MFKVDRADPRLLQLHPVTGDLTLTLGFWPFIVFRSERCPVGAISVPEGSPQYPSFHAILRQQEWSIWAAITEYLRQRGYPIGVTIAALEGPRPIVVPIRDVLGRVTHVEMQLTITVAPLTREYFERRDLEDLPTPLEATAVTLGSFVDEATGKGVDLKAEVGRVLEELEERSMSPVRAPVQVMQDVVERERLRAAEVAEQRRIREAADAALEEMKSPVVVPQFTGLEQELNGREEEAYRRDCELLRIRNTVPGGEGDKKPTVAEDLHAMVDQQFFDSFPKATPAPASPPLNLDDDDASDGLEEV